MNIRSMREGVQRVQSYHIVCQLHHAEKNNWTMINKMLRQTPLLLSTVLPSCGNDHIINTKLNALSQLDDKY